MTGGMKYVQAAFVAACLVLAGAPTAHAAHGYDVFRPWAVAPGPCPGTCSGAESGGAPVTLKAWFDAQAAAHPGVVTRVVYGGSFVAYRVGTGAPVMYVGGQHGRDWLGVEVVRRQFAEAIAHPVSGTAMWFVPVVDPDAYDATFASKAARLAQDVDLDRNWPETFHYDDEGSGPDRGSGPASEPAVAALDDLLHDVDPAYLIDYQSGGGRILYPEAWQIATPATDAPAFEALAGDDDHPAIAGYDPDVAGEIATANGTLIDHAYARYGTQGFVVALAGGSGPGVGGTVNGPDSGDPDGPVFQDSETDIQAEYAKGLDFALDLARSAPDPSRPDSHLGNHAPDFVAHEFPLSYGDPQRVEVTARRALGAVTVHWKAGGVERTASTAEVSGERYGAPGAVYHRLRATVTGFSAGDTVEVWFEGGGQRSASFTFTAAQTHAGDVLVLAAEDYSGSHPGPPHAGPEYLSAYTDALTALGRSYSVYDIDAHARKAPDALGVLSHFRAVLWYTGDDVFTRDAAQPNSTGTTRTFGLTLLAARDYLNAGGKLLVAGSTALQGAWRQLNYNPLAETPYCQFNNLHGLPAHDHPTGQTANCVPASDDFLQYYLGARQMVEAGSSPAFDGFAVDGDVEAFIVGSGAQAALQFAGPAKFVPTSGTRYAYAQSTDEGYARLTRTIDLTGGASPHLTFRLGFDTEPDFDHVFVEAHEVGQNDWTTLADLNGHTSTDTGEWCEPDWETLHPFLDHFIAAGGCARTGATGTWNAATGNSGGMQAWDVDLSPWIGKQVEVSIAYAQDYGTGGLGVYVDDARGEDFEHGLGAWSADGFQVRTRVVDAPGVATGDTQLWGFGLEDVQGAAARAKLLGDALAKLAPAVIDPPPPPTPEPPAETPAAPARFVSGDRLKVDSKGRVRVQVTCAQACAGAVRLASERGRFVRVLARTTYRIAGGHGATIRLHLTRGARRSLARSHSLKATLRLSSNGREVAKRTVRLR
jgi:Zinc carboxypeptidase